MRFDYCRSLKFCPEWFITRQGYVFKIQSGREIHINVMKSQSGHLYIQAPNGNQYRLIDLMIEYWIGPIKASDRIQFKPDGNTIPLNNIRIKPFVSRFDIDEEDEIKLHLYKCDERARSANYRADEFVTPIEVYMALKSYNFKCVYCGKDLKPEKWQLDHYYPLSKENGSNRFENLVPSCPRCNHMKGSLDPLQFIRHCVRVANDNIIGNESIQKALEKGSAKLT